MPTVRVKWDEVRVRSWQAFIKAIEPTLDAYNVPPSYLFRGQTDSSWPLSPSLLRRVSDLQDRAGTHKIENLLEQEFLAQAALYPETRDVRPSFDFESRTEVWAYMQHHGCATRLLDWTASAFVAAYFAVNELPKKDGALFFVAPDALEQYITHEQPGLKIVTDDSLVDVTMPARVTFTWPKLKSNRMVAQQGHFSVSTNVLEPHDGSIVTACSAIALQQPGKVIFRKIVIAAKLKLVILQQLMAMNVTPQHLFPGLDGLGRSLSDLASLKAILNRMPG